MEEKVFGTGSVDEAKTPVRQFLDRAFSHLCMSV
jgi:hypothetical protein